MSKGTHQPQDAANYFYPFAVITKDYARQRRMRMLLAEPFFFFLSTLLTRKLVVSSCWASQTKQWRAPLVSFLLHMACPSDTQILPPNTVSAQIYPGIHMPCGCPSFQWTPNPQLMWWAFPIIIPCLSLIFFFFFLWLCWIFIVLQGLSSPVACGTLVPWPGIKPSPLHWEYRVLATEPPGKSQGWRINGNIERRSLLVTDRTRKRREMNLFRI